MKSIKDENAEFILRKSDQSHGIRSFMNNPRQETNITESKNSSPKKFLDSDDFYDEDGEEEVVIIFFPLNIAKYIVYSLSNTFDSSPRLEGKNSCIKLDSDSNFNTFNQITLNLQNHDFREYDQTNKLLLSLDISGEDPFLSALSSFRFYFHAYIFGNIYFHAYILENDLKSKN